jgi:hypothetical protein
MANKRIQLAVDRSSTLAYDARGGLLPEEQRQARRRELENLDQYEVRHSQGQLASIHTLHVMKRRSFGDKITRRQHCSTVEQLGGDSTRR